MDRTRRDLLASGALALASLAAGCQSYNRGASSPSSIAPTATSSPTTSPTAAPPEEIAAGSWVPAPGAVGFEGYYPNGYVVDRWRYDEARERGDDLPRDVREALTVPEDRVLRHTGVDPGAVHQEVRVGWTVADVYRGSFDRTSVGESLAGAGFEQVDSDTSFDVYATDHEDDVVTEFAYAVSGHTVVRSRGEDPSTPITVVQRILATGGGDRERYVETSPTFARLTDVLGDLTAYSAWVHEEREESNPPEAEFRGKVGLGWGPEVRPGRTTLLLAVVFADGVDVPIEQVREYVDGHGGFVDYDSVTVERRDRVALVEAEMPTARFDGLRPGDP